MFRRRAEADTINHQMWVISYADMVTLMFALFVVLYSLGEVKLSKLRDLRQSLAFAFSFDGDLPADDEAIYGRGDRVNRIDGLSLMFQQDEATRVRLLHQLPARFEQLTGKPITIHMSDDRVEFRGTLDSFYDPRSSMIRASVQSWLGDVADAALSFTTHVEIGIRAPNVVIGEDENGCAERPGPLCLQRLERVLQLFSLMPRVLIENVDTGFDYTLDRDEDWEAVGTIGFAFKRG